MRTRFGTSLVATVVLAVGAVAGWLAAQLGKCENVEVCKYGNMETANAVDKPRRKALIRSSADAEVQKRILENKISHLEKCIAAAKGENGRARSPSAPPAEKKREANAEIVARLMKLPTENERWTELGRLDRKTNMAFTLGEMKRLCPEHTTLDEPRVLDNLDKITEFSARRIGIIAAFDLSGLSDEERKVHAEYMRVIAELPDAYANMIDQNDSMTMGEAWERIEKVISASERCAKLHKKENAMLISQMVKCFEIPDGDAAELRATLDDVKEITSL